MTKRGWAKPFKPETNSGICFAKNIAGAKFYKSIEVVTVFGIKCQNCF
jgi:hypothetical protein